MHVGTKANFTTLYFEDSNASDSAGWRGGGGGALSLTFSPFFPFLILLVLWKVFVFFCQYFQMCVMFYDRVKDSFGLFSNDHCRTVKSKRLFCIVLYCTILDSNLSVFFYRNLQ